MAEDGNNDEYAFVVEAEGGEYVLFSITPWGSMTAPYTQSAIEGRPQKFDLLRKPKGDLEAKFEVVDADALGEELYNHHLKAFKEEYVILTGSTFESL